MNDKYVKPWTVGQLREAMERDLSLCNSQFERINCEAMHRIGMKKFIAGLTRKLTPGEVAIKEELGV